MSWINRFRNHMRQEAQRATADLSLPRAGIVTGSIDPVRQMARVLIQPENILSAYLPIHYPWVGNGWGMAAPPVEGQVVDVHFQQGGRQAAYISLRAYNAGSVPPPAPAGEFWLVHQTGSFIKLTNAGDILISAARDLNLHAGRRFIFDANGQGQIWDGTGVETWQDNDVSKPHHDHAPPQIPS